LNNATFAAPAAVTLTAATATNAGVTITKVDFYVGTTRIVTKTVGPSPYIFDWSGVSPGTYALSAKAYDSLGSVVTSNIVNITVNPTVTVTAGPGGTVTPSGVVVVPFGTTQTFAIAPTGANLLTDVLVDGVSVGAVASYQFANVTANHTIAASFATVPAAPVATVATLLTPNGFTATWGAVPNATSYSLDVSTSNSLITFAPGYKNLNVGNVTSFAVTGLSPGTTYYYQVRANNGVLVSPNSNTIAAATLANVALQSNGGVATASSSYSGYPAAAVNNGDRLGVNLGAGGVWADNTAATFPDWVQVTFNGPKSVSEIDVFTLQDKFTSPVVPTAGQIFNLYGIKNFDVQYWNGTGWTTVPGGSITNNNLVWKKITLASPVTTNQIRVLVNGSSYPYSFITEVEAWSDTPVSPPNVITVTQGANGTITPAGDASGNVQVVSGGNLTFTIAASPGYIITDVKADNVSVGAVSSYTYTNVTANHTITATFGVFAPTATAATPVSATSFTANWNTLTGATGYFLDVATDNLFTQIVAGYNNLAIAGTSSPVTVPIAGTYFYRVRATVAAAVTANSNTITVVTSGGGGIPVAPTAAAATAITATGFTANWSTVTGATGYLLDVSTVNSFATFVTGYNGLPVNATSYSVTGLTAGTTYYYQVRATNAAGSSGNSTPPVSVATLAGGGVLTNVALQANGGVATASSSFSSAYPATAVNNGDRAGTGLGAGGVWTDNTSGVFPDWVQVNFNGAKSISEIDVFTVQDNYTSPVAPTAGQTFTLYGITAFDVQYNNGAGWVTVPGGSITNNNLVWKKITLATPVTASQIRVLVNGSKYAYSFITEIEAWGQ
jgi:hypothetical protein